MTRQSGHTAGTDGASTPALLLRDLSFAYAKDRPVLENINLTVPQGDFLALIGPNGGGKTTLLGLLLGMHSPVSGSLEVLGAPPGELTGHIGYVPQFSTIHNDFPASVLDMTLMGAARPDKRGAYWPVDKASRDKAISYLSLLGLTEHMHRSIGELSGGQRQRALVARALMSFPERFPRASGSGPAPYILLLDEPTASIDPEGTFCFYEFLGQLRGSITIIVVSHDLFMVSPFFSRVAFVNKTLTVLAQNELTAENLTLLFGHHLHDCPVGDMLHAGNILHPTGCSHPSCNTHQHDAAPLPPGRAKV